MTSSSLRLFTVAAVASALIVSACSGGAGGMGGGMPQPGTNGGVAMVTLTDLPGDFLSYAVNVVSLKLTRADGTVVETVPATARVDFAQLVNLSEVVSAQQVPAGAYTGVSLTLDYNGATIIVDNGAGGLAVPAGNLVNSSTGMPLVPPNSQVTLTVQLPSGRPLVITRGTVAHLALDFNLSASNSVAPATIDASTAASAVTVTVSAMLSASLMPDVTKQIRVRGPLVSVTNTSTETSYTVMVRPFFTADADEGQAVVHTTPTTTFTLNGTSFTGNAGLSALAALGPGTLTAATGSFDTQTETFTATVVLAGTSVPGAGLDGVEGTVIARSGNIFTLSNGFLEPRAGGSMGSGAGEAEMFSRQLSVTVAATTTVTESGQSGTFSPQDISVGQHLQVFGTFGMDSGGNRTLDASMGSAQLMLTPVLGRFGSSAAGVVTASLLALDGRQPSLFNFAGTGTRSVNDATASAYTVNVPAALPVPTLTAGSPILFFGFVTPFGSAPPDFSAVSLVNFATLNAELRLEWEPPGVTAPFVAPLSATSVVITQTMLQSASEREIRLGFEELDPASVSSGLSFVANPAAPFTAFAIGHRMSWRIEAFSTFGDLITALTAELNGTTALLKVDAEGPYNQSTGVLSVNRMGVELSD